MFFSRLGIVLQRLQTIADVEEKLALPQRVGAGIPTFWFFGRGDQLWVPSDAPRGASGADKITIGIKGARVQFGPALRKVGAEVFIAHGRLHEYAFLLVLDFKFSRHMHDVELRKFAPFDPNQIIVKGADVAFPRINNLPTKRK